MNQSIEVLDFPDEVEISPKLTLDEMPNAHLKEVAVKLPKKEGAGPAFHEKKEKNKKVNIKITRAHKLKLKYKKPKTRGQKRK